MNESQPIIFYDGLCGLCDKSVQFVLKHDKKKQFKFATLQSDFAYNTIGKPETDSFVLLDQGKIYMESTAALRTLKRLGGVWSLAAAFLVIPTFIRNAVYRFVARNRYKWFGKFDSCKVPDAATRSRFIA
jgi:predicted DCC family thiol-disulfide oxidoreductase YuxK